MTVTERFLRPAERGSRRPGLAVVCVALFVTLSATQAGFLSTDNVTNIALNGAPLLIAAMGTMTLLVSGNVDLSIGSQYALVSVATAIVVQESGSSVLGAGFALLLGAFLGTVNGLLVVALSISPLIVTLGMLAIYRGMAFVVGDGFPVAGLPTGFVEFGLGEVLGIPHAVLVAAVVFLVGWWHLSATRPGLRLFAIGGDRDAARLAGVPVRAHVVGAFALNGALIGVVALLQTAKLGSGSPLVGVQFEIAVLTAVILGGVSFSGGLGHPIGVLTATLTLGVMDAGLIFSGWLDWHQQLARGGLLIAALAVDQFARWWVRNHRTDASPGPPPEAHAEATTHPAPNQESAPMLEVRGVTAGYAGVTALVDASLTVRAGEVVCLVGDNGAGKSTLIRVVAGSLRPTAGEVEVGGAPVPADPGRARRIGVETVYQHPALCLNLGIGENLMLGLEPTRRLGGALPIIDFSAARATVRERFAQLGVDLGDLRRPLLGRSGGQRQIVAIARALRPSARVVLLDEPTAALGVTQAAQIHALTHRIASSGRCVLLVTHDIEEVFAVADRVVVLQRGRMIFDGPIGQVTRLELMRLMSGRAQAEAARTTRAIASERKRIERAIHDGTQHQLVTASLVLQLASDQLTDAGVEEKQLQALLGSTRETLAAAISELRDLARGVYPGVLTEKGLVAALDALVAREPTPTTLRVGDVPRLEEATEATAYFIVCEALTNTSKHASATQCEVLVELRDGDLLVTVTDNGTSAVDETRGSGLRGLRERAAALGGSLTVTGGSGLGTRLRASLPARPIAAPSRRIVAD